MMFSDSKQLLARTDKFNSDSGKLSFDSKVGIDGQQDVAGRRTNLRAELGILHERIEMLAEDFGRLDDRHFRRDGPRRPKDQLR